MTEICLKAEVYQPSVELNIMTDQDDNMVLELAEESNADFTIAGNTNDFTMSEHKNTKIVTPKEYWENHIPE